MQWIDLNDPLQMSTIVKSVWFYFAHLFRFCCCDKRHFFESRWLLNWPEYWLTARKCTVRKVKMELARNNRTSFWSTCCMYKICEVSTRAKQQESLRYLDIYWDKRLLFNCELWLLMVLCRSNRSNLCRFNRSRRGCCTKEGKKWTDMQ